MRLFDYCINFMIAVILIVGGYQFYFLSQKWSIRFPFEFKSRIDSFIPFWPAWVWIYTGVFYPTLLSVVFTIHSFEKFNRTVFTFIILLGFQLLLFLVFPTATPKRWRGYKPNATVSTKLLTLIQRYDARSNSFPSAHVSIATLAAIHLFSNLAPVLGKFALACFLFPLLISASAVLTKQHYFIDIVPGAVLGWLVFEIFSFP